jgi:hypothetical protein
MPNRRSLAAKVRILFWALSILGSQRSNGYHEGVNRFALLSALSLLFVGQGCGLLCIAEGSSISTPTGHRLIEQLREGDAVHSVDVRTGVLVEARITAIRRSVRECMTLDMGGERLRCTPTHPIYDPDTDSYRGASDWVTSGATTVARVVDERVIHQAVTSVSVYAGLLEVFDLSVDGPHSNFIANGVVVHNKTPAPGDGEGDYGYETGSDEPQWLEDTPEIPCDNPIPSGHLCLTIESREYQLAVSSAAISGDGTVLNMVFESSSEDAFPRLTVNYPADATTSVSCNDPDTWTVLDFGSAILGPHNSELDGGCSLTIGEQPASPGATLSGTMTAKLDEGAAIYSVAAEWVEIPVAE